MSEVKETEKDGRLPGPVVAIIIAAIVIAGAVLVFSQKQKFSAMVPGTESVDFTLPDLHGKKVSLSDYRGKVVFLNFWASWCKPCEQEMPSMQELYRSMRGAPFEILAVSIDSGSAESVEGFVKERGVTFPVLQDKLGTIKDIYKTTGVPETFIIDQNGVIAEKIVGPRNWTAGANIRTIIDLLRNGPRPKEQYRKVVREN